MEDKITGGKLVSKEELMEILSQPAIACTIKTITPYLVPSQEFIEELKSQGVNVDGPIEIKNFPFRK